MSTRSAASATIHHDIFELPRVRSAKVIGTSWTRRPTCGGLRVPSLAPGPSSAPYVRNYALGALGLLALVGATAAGRRRRGERGQSSTGIADARRRRRGDREQVGVAG